MQTASAAFAAAVESNAFITDTRVTILPSNSSPVSAVLVSYLDWSEVIKSAEIDESIVTDAPEETRLITGYSARSANLTLAYSKPFDKANPDQTAGWLLDPYNQDSPLFRQDVLGTNIKIEIGVVPANSYTAEFVTKFTGVIDSCNVNAQTGEIAISCLDNRGKLSSAPSLPIAAGAPRTAFEVNSWGFSGGLTPHWALDYLVNRAGYRSYPPRLSNTFLEVSFHGSADPEKLPTNWIKGNLFSFSAFTPYVFEDPYYTEFVQGKWSSQIAPFSQTYFIGGTAPDTVKDATTYPLSIGMGHSYEWWQGPSGIPDSYDPAYGYFHPKAGVSASEGAFVAAAYQSAPGQVQAFYTVFGSSSVTANIGPVISDGLWHRYYWQFSLVNSTTALVELWIDNTYYSNTVTTAGTFTDKVIDYATYQCDLPIEALQVTIPVPLAQLPGPPDYSDFEPTAVLDPNLQNIVLPPIIEDADSWGVIQAIGSSEGMFAGFDEVGVFRSKNRITLATQESVREVTSATSLKTLEYYLTRANFRNRIRIPGDFFAEGITPTQIVWTPEEPFYLRAGASWSAVVNLSEPAVGLGVLGEAGVPVLSGGPFYYILAPYLFFTSSQFNDGTGAAAWINPAGLTVYADRIDSNTFKVTALNRSNRSVWMAVPNSLANTIVAAASPGIIVMGSVVKPPNSVTGTTYVESIDEYSRTQNGEQYLLMDANPWQQVAEHVQQYADDLLADLSIPKPYLSNVSWVPDPRLQLTDRITLVDPDVTTIREDCLIIGMNWNLADGQWECTADLRTYGPPGSWIMGEDGRSEMGVTTYA